MAQTNAKLDLASEPDFFGTRYDATGYANSLLNRATPVTADRSSTSAGTAAVDPTFNPVIDSAPGFARATAVQPDGKILVAGSFRTLNGTRVTNITRLNPDYSIDPTFNATTNGSVMVIALQPDGKILLGGFFTAVNGSGQNYIARLLPNGGVDNTFNTNGGASAPIYDVVVQPDGMILIAGSFIQIGGVTHPNVARLNATGSVDDGFSATIPLPAPPNFLPSIVYSLSLQPDGKVMIGGLIVKTTFPTQTTAPILRLNVDGSTDNSFDPGTINSNALKVAVQPDGKILMCGFFSTINGTLRNRIARFNANGSLDTSFDPGLGADVVIYTFNVLPNGSILVGGRFNTFNGQPRRNLALLSPEGALDSNFVPASGNGTVYSLVPNANGKVLVAGAIQTIFAPVRDSLLLVNANGTVDDSLNLNSTAIGGMRALAIQPDGKIVVVGVFNRVNGEGRTRVARLNANGTLDQSFNAGTLLGNPITTLLVQPDGKILVGGVTVVRLNADGSLDPSFTQSTGAPSRSIRSIAVQPDGKILISYTVAVLGQPGTGDISRLNADGSLDTSFDGVPLPFEAIVVEPDGKILAGGPVSLGYVTSGAGTEMHNGIFRLNADGSHDRTFRSGFVSNDGGAGFTSVYALERQSDGKVLVGGSLYTAASTQPVGMARLTTSGGIDGSFQLNPVSSPIEFPRAEDIQVLSNGKIMVGGLFDHFGSAAQNNLARLNPDGTMDGSFVANADGPVFDLGVDASGKILIGGDFETVNGASRTGLARLLGQAPAPAAYDFDGDGRSDISVFRPTDANWYLLQSSAGPSTVNFGNASDELVPADYDGDGKTDVAVFRGGVWYLLGSQTGFRAFSFGSPGDIPQPADFDGDGRAELAVFRPADGNWYKLDIHANLFSAVSFGQNGDRPVVGDYDGDGKADAAVYRGGDWFILGSTQGFYGFNFGFATDKTVPADYDGDGKIDPAVFRDGVWYLLRSTAGFTGLQWGIASDVPVPADYDGDGKTDVAVYRDGQWHLLLSSGGYNAVAFGLASDKPVPSAFVR